MPLDPHLAAVLAAAPAGPRLEELPPAEARAVFRQQSALLASAAEPAAIGSVATLEVAGGESPLTARVYRPESAGPRPTIAFFHGGGFVIGDLDTHEAMARELCRAADAVVVSVDYRLAPEHPFPAATDDAVAAARWISGHLPELGGSPVLAVAGDSAGANLATVAARVLAAEGVALAGQLLVYPATDADGVHPSRTENGSGYLLESSTVDWFLDQYVPAPVDRRSPRVSPLLATDLSGLPPAVVVTAELDPLRDEGEEYAAALRAAGVPTTLLRCDGMVHGFFSMGGVSPAAQRHIGQALDHFAALLHAA